MFIQNIKKINMCTKGFSCNAFLLVVTGMIVTGFALTGFVLTGLLVTGFVLTG